MDTTQKPGEAATPQSQSGQDDQNTQLYQPQNPASHTDQSAYEGYDLTAQPEVRQPVSAEASVSWEASEYIHHAKGAGWVAGLVIVTAAMVGVAIWLQAWTFVVLLVIMAVAMGVYAFRPPHTLHYLLNRNGLQIGDKSYPFADFRAFGIISDGAFYTIMLIPTKRFMPAVNIYFSEEDGEKIVDILGQSLPMEQLELDPVEKLMRRLRF